MVAYNSSFNLENISMDEENWWLFFSPVWELGELNNDIFIMKDFYFHEEVFNVGIDRKVKN